MLSVNRIIIVIMIILTVTTLYNTTTTTGKTSIATSIADALGRKFYRFSVGGLNDVR